MEEGGDSSPTASGFLGEAPQPALNKAFLMYLSCPSGFAEVCV